MRMLACKRERTDGMMMMIVVGVDKWKQGNMCYYNAIDVEKSEKDAEE